MIAYSRLTRDQARIMIHIYEVTIIDVKGCNDFQSFNLAKITRNYYTPATRDHVVSVTA